MFSALLAKVESGASLTSEESQAAIAYILTGNAADDDVAAFLTHLHRRGETEAEVLGAARGLRAHMQVFEGAEDALDIVGTGGDNHGTYNISSAVIFILAGAGIKIAKHGNRAVSSKSGASDFLSSLGIRVDVPQKTMQKAYEQANVAFLMAPLYHTAMKHVAPIRARLGFRTIFNLLGPLSNPARAKRQLVGVFDRKWCAPFAHILSSLGSTHAWVAHGLDGLDEITTTTESIVCTTHHGTFASRDIHPSDAGLPLATLAELKGGDGAHNAAAFMRLLAGEKSAYRNIVLLNAAAGFIIAEKAASLAEGVALAEESLQKGLAAKALETFKRITNEV